MWSLYENNKELKPLVFSNGKTQEDIVSEVIKSVKNGDKVIFIRGVCGTGKSAIALNIAKELGKASIVVPVKALQKQYEDDYMNKKYLLKENGEKLKIEVITGRSNHICPFLKENDIDINEDNKDKKEQDTNIFDFSNGLKIHKKEEIKNIKDSSQQVNSCDNFFLPCKIEIKPKNFRKIQQYLKKNNKVDLRNFNSIMDVRRMSIAPICPYWSPIVPSTINLDLEANKKSYKGTEEIENIIYKRKNGCGYYDQFNCYVDADVIIFNSQKYKIESSMNRKPATEVEIIDECDEFLDSFSNYKRINLDRLNMALGSLFTDSERVQGIINELIKLTNKIIDEKKNDDSSEDIIHIKETEVLSLLKYFLNSDFMSNVECDEENYCYNVLETAMTFEDFLDETFLSFQKEEKDIIIKLITINLEKRFKELLDKNKVFVMMSGTIHSEKVLKDIFGISDFKVIEAETNMPGTITEKRTGQELDCRYENFRTGRITREKYLLALERCVKEAEKPLLVHVNSFNDLPSEYEKEKYGLSLLNQEKLKKLQDEDSFGENVKKFKDKDIDILYSTKCNRGVDFPGDVCKSIILTKYPYPNVKALFWKILKKNKPLQYNEFYVDKAKREFLQRIYRGLRSQNDHIFLLSPDIRVFNRRT